MLGGLFKRKQQQAAEAREREVTRDLKIMESQRLLLEAATSTADAANVVTNRLKARLEDSIAQFESTVRIMNDALIICDTDGAVQAFNPAAERLFGYSADAVRDHFVGELFTSLTHPLADGADVWSLLAIMDAAEHDHDLNGKRADATEFPLDVNHTQLDRSDGTSIVLLILRDLTPCDAKRHRPMCETGFDGVLVVSDGKIVAANPAVSYLFGYSVEELLTKSLDTLVVRGSSLIRGEVGSETVKIAAEGRHEDGRTFDVFFSTTTIFWNGEPASLVTIKDMAPVTRTDKMPDAPNMICCFGADYKITFVNTIFCNYYGERREALIGRDIRDLMPEGERSLFQIHISGLSEMDPTRRMQLQTTRPDGEPCLQIWTDHASFDADGAEYQRVGRDVSGVIKSKDRS